jgi:hypothetical protein
MIATLADFYRTGIRAAMLAPQARTIVSVDQASDALFQPMHGLAVADPVRLQVNVGGVLPAPLNATTVYYAIPVDGDSTKLATTAQNATDGVAIDLTTAGAGVLGLVASIEPLILAQLEEDAGEIEDALKAYLGPLQTPFPPKVVKVNTALSAFGVASTLGMLNPAEPTKDIENLKARYQVAREALAQWRLGQLLPASTVDASPGVLENGTVYETDLPFDCVVLT